MATLNLGRIKPVFRGAYNNSTAYVVDDIVTSGGSSYICIQASTGNAVSNATYWTQMAAGGTDVGTTLTTQGDILYRDASGLARLGYGTAGQVLQTGGSGANPSWGTVSSDCVKLASNSFSAVSAVQLDGTSVWGASNTFAYHKVILRVTPSDNATQLRSRLVASGSEITSTIYNYATSYIGSNNGGAGGSNIKAYEGDSFWEFTRDGMDEVGTKMWEFTVFNLNYSSSLDANNDTVQIIGHSALNNHDGSQRMHGTQCFGMITTGSAPSNTTGLQFMGNQGTFTGNYHVYGFKK